MRARTGLLLAVVAIAAVVVAAAIAQYNGFVRRDQRVRSSWAQVENVLQRRNDLIPNLVETVRGYAKHEKDVFLEVTRARSSLLQAATVQEKAAASSELERALGRLLLVVENYPQLKANQNFLALQDELAGTENRISVERMRYNEAVEGYNRVARAFPGVLFVRLFGFDSEKEYFRTVEGSAVPPAVRF